MLLIDLIWHTKRKNFHAGACTIDLGKHHNKHVPTNDVAAEFPYLYIEQKS